jgi:ferrous iron transport protein B
VFGILIVIEISAGLLLNKILKQERVSDFILEIPPIRFPVLKNLMTKTYYRVKWFLIEAVPLFMLGSAILFVMDKLHLLAVIKRGIFPILVSFLHLPEQVVDAFLLSLTRKEAGAVILLNLAQQQQLDYIQAIVGTIVLTCFFPCFANIMSIAKELGTRSALLMLLVITVVSVIMGGMINYLLRMLL